ncbi:MAG: DUF711 family protein [bacterium]
MKVRTVTFFYRFKDFFIGNDFLRFLSNAKSVEEDFSKAGFKPQTVRVTTNISDFISSERDVKNSLILEDICEDFGFTFVNYGKFNKNIRFLPLLFDRTKNVSASSEINCSSEIDFNMLERASSVIPDISDLGKNKNFNYSVSMNIREHTPFYPASYASKEGFSIGFENGDLLQKSFFNAKSFTTAGKILLETLNKNYIPVEERAKMLSKKHKIAYLGIDTSFAPGLNKDDSVMKSFDILKKNTGANYLAIAGLITDAAKRAEVKRVGYCGLMLPVCEDIYLAKEADERKVNIERLLFLSTVCGCGLDTIPVSGNIGKKRISAILLDTATLSKKLQKPLSVRLLPVKGIKKGERTKFSSKYLVDSKAME